MLMFLCKQTSAEQYYILQNIFSSCQLAYKQQLRRLVVGQGYLMLARQQQNIDFLAREIMHSVVKFWY